jgi:GT2 family glycosyltransferase
LTPEIGAAADTTFAPIAVVEVELSAAIAAPEASNPEGVAFGSARLFARLHGRPLGSVETPVGPDGFSAQACAEAIWAALQAEINVHLQADDLPAITQLTAAGIPPSAEPACQALRRQVLADPPFASVVVCTKDRPAVVDRVLRSIAKLDYPDYETIVIDGSPGVETEALIRANHPTVRHVRLKGGGVVVGRNRALAEAKAEMLAYVDDDAVVDRDWLTEHIAGLYQDPNIACTTGYAIPFELATQAQAWFEELGAFVEGVQPRTISVSTRPPGSLLPYATGRIGSGVSMAWRASALRRIGGFDLALDKLGAEDISAFYEALCAGYAISFWPGAVVHHEHRRDYAALRGQVRSYARGLGAYLFRCLFTHPARIPDFLIRVPLGLIYTFSPNSIRNNKRSSSFPAEFTGIQRKALLGGPWAYLKGRRLARSRAYRDFT